LPETVSPELVHEVIEGRVFASFGSPEGELATLARACRALQVAGPTPMAEERVRSHIRALAAQGSSEPGPWPFGNPLVERLAAGALILGLLGGGASAATGVTPAEFARESTVLVRSLIVNLDPRNGGTEDAPAPEPTPSAAAPASTPGPTVEVATPSPAPAAATVIPTADPDPTPDDFDDDSGPSQNSGSGSQNSGSGSSGSGSDDGPGDDNGGERREDDE
jgi:hypothetical protein